MECRASDDLFHELLSNQGCYHLPLSLDPHRYLRTIRRNYTIGEILSKSSKTRHSLPKNRIFVIFKATISYLTPNLSICDCLQQLRGHKQRETKEFLLNSVKQNFLGETEDAIRYALHGWLIMLIDMSFLRSDFEYFYRTCIIDASLESCYIPKQVYVHFFCKHNTNKQIQSRKIR